MFLSVTLADKVFSSISTDEDSVKAAITLSQAINNHEIILVD